MSPGIRRRRGKCRPQIAWERGIVAASSAPSWCSWCLWACYCSGNTRGLIFTQDEWDLLQFRLDWKPSSFLDPANQHLLALTFLLYKLLFVTVGIDHYWPYRVMEIGVHLLCVFLLFLVVRRRLGDVPALLVTLPMMVLGSAWELLLMPYDVQWLISLAALLGFLLLFERRDRRSEAVCCLLLVVGFTASSMGLPMLAGALLAILRDQDRRRRLWIVLLPIALYGLWFVTWRVGAANQRPDTFAIDPIWLFNLMAATFGLGRPSPR